MIPTTTLAPNYPRYHPHALTIAKGIHRLEPSIVKYDARRESFRDVPTQGAISASKIKDIVPKEMNWLDPGSMLFTTYETETGELFVIRGDRFNGQKRLSTGGAVDGSETFKQTALREFNEETFGIFTDKNHKDFITEAYFLTYMAEPELRPRLQSMSKETLAHRSLVIPWGYNQAVFSRIIEINYQTLDQKVQLMNSYAKAANDALNALTGGYKGDLIDAQRKELAQGVIVNKPAIALFQTLGTCGEAAIELIREISISIVDNSNPIPKEDFRNSDIAKAIKTFTECSHFELINIDQAKKDLLNINIKSAGSEKKAIPSLIEDINNRREGSDLSD